MAAAEAYTATGVAERAADAGFTAAAKAQSEGMAAAGVPRVRAQKRMERPGVTAKTPIHPPTSSYHATNKQKLTFLNRHPRNSDQSGGSDDGRA